MRGRRPKPTALKKLQGNPGKRPLNPAEPKPVPEPTVCPDYLDEIARREWLRVSNLLTASGILTVIDSTALAAYCQAYAHWIEAETKLKETGPIIRTPGGYPMLNPHFILAKTALQQMHKFLVEFGMTPSSRSRLHIDSPVTAADPLEAYLKRGAEKSKITIQ